MVLFSLFHLPFPLLNSVWWTIFNEVALTAQSGPFWLTILDVDNALAIEHVAAVKNYESVPRLIDEVDNTKAYVGAKLFFSFSLLNLIKVGKSKIMFRPSSMIGVLQYAQLTLQGNLCVVVFSELSYQPKSWWPWVKFMSSLRKIAAHWNGAPA